MLLVPQRVLGGGKGNEEEGDGTIGASLSAPVAVVLSNFVQVFLPLFGPEGPEMFSLEVELGVALVKTDVDAHPSDSVLDAGGEHGIELGRHLRGEQGRCIVEAAMGGEVRGVGELLCPVDANFTSFAHPALEMTIGALSTSPSFFILTPIAAPEELQTICDDALGDEGENYSGHPSPYLVPRDGLFQRHPFSPPRPQR